MVYVRTSPGAASFLSTCFVELERSTNGVGVGDGVSVDVGVTVLVLVGVGVFVGIDAPSCRLLPCGLSASAGVAASMDETASGDDGFPPLSALIGAISINATKTKPKIKNSNAHLIMV
jgi:hypothetical protein